MEAQVETNHILIGSRQMRGQICGPKLCITPNTDHQITLSGVKILVRPEVLWNQHQVELPKRSCQLIHASICTSGTSQISAQSANVETARTTWTGKT